MHAIIPFDRFNPDDFSFFFGARPISPHERGSIRATRLRCAPQATLSPALPRGGGGQYAPLLWLCARACALARIRQSGTAIAAVRAIRRAFVRAPAIRGSWAPPQKSRSQIPASNQWLGGAVCVALGERRTERLNLNYSHEILIWCGTCDDGLASRNVSTPSL